MATPSPFAEPFGLAWLGFVIYALIIIGVGWLLVVFSPWIIAAFTWIIRIASLPYLIISGKRKQGVRSTRKATKQLFKINKR